MPTFYFEWEDGTRVVPDQEGSEAADAEEARQMALQTLADLTRAELPLDDDHRVFTIRVEDADRRSVLTASLTLAVERSS